ncbi:uncharacterized protein LOC144749911 [Ciona intestinalis]
MENQDSNLAAVSLKLPAFWKLNAAAWFHTVEAQMHVRNITADNTKYYYVVSALDSESATAVSTVLDQPPNQNKFETIKRELLAVYELTEKQKKRLLLELNGLGDRTPVQLYRYMRTLHSAPKDDVLFMAFFLRQLPVNVQAILAARDFTDVEKMALAAEEVMATSSHPITALNSRTRPRPLPQPTTQAGTEHFCYYHRRWGKQAKQCRQPCSWAGNAPTSH